MAGASLSAQLVGALPMPGGSCPYVRARVPQPMPPCDPPDLPTAALLTGPASGAGSIL
jgi:hypothetical protein